MIGRLVNQLQHTPESLGPAYRRREDMLQRLEPSRLRVLLVEDHRDTRFLLTRLLQRAGFTVQPAGSVEEARAIAQAGAHNGSGFHLLISDIGLPDGDGRELLRNINPIQPLPAIAVSGLDSSGEIRKSIEAGFSRHLVKPIDFDELLFVIEDVLLEHAYDEDRARNRGLPPNETNPFGPPQHRGDPH
jgi:DNA-binding response OmpR family regulator